MLEAIFLLIGFAALIYGANILVDSASSLAKQFNVPNIIIGLTIVAFGTSAPELVVNVYAAIMNQSEIVLGNVIGSNIFNILIILGISALIISLNVKNNSIKFEIPLAIMAAVLVSLLSIDKFLSENTSSVISRLDGVILLMFFIIFMIYNVVMMKKGEFSEEINVKALSKTKAITFIVLGIVLLSVGGRLIVDASVSIAEKIGVSQRIIALTIISIGTSLPELATSIIAARKKNTDIAIGNIVGSNIFNTFFILSISAIINPIPVSDKSIFDLLVNILASVLLLTFVFTGKGKRIDKLEGIIFIAIYVAYIVYLIIN
jgi:cation:H+ antiporter